MKKYPVFLLLVFLLHGLAAWSQSASFLQSGPMVGYSEMKEVMLWVQTKEAAAVQITYWDKAEPGKKYKTAEVTTQKANAFAAHLLADAVQPGKKYSYEVYLNKKKVERNYPMEFQSQSLWHWRTDPPDFRFALGSCAYINEEGTDRPGTPYGGNEVIFTSIATQKPDFMVWLGDNTYFRETDWNTRTGMLHRYTHTRSTPEMQPLLASAHHYAIWDDHDYGPNDADRGFWGKEMSADIFKLFWANPNYNVTGAGGITGSFVWNDVQFFLLDDRYFKTPNDNKVLEHELLGKAQVQWLIDALTFSKATFKFVAVGGQVLNPAAVYENYANYAQERAYLLGKIKEANIPGVVFFDGDRHLTSLTKLNREGTYPLYDLTVSPLTSGASNSKEANNTALEPGTLVNERNFATIDIKGPLKERVMTIKVFSTQGQQLWTRDIAAKELK